MKRFLILFLLVVMTLGLVTTVFAVESDPAGMKTGRAVNVPTADDFKTYNF